VSDDTGRGGAAEMPAAEYEITTLARRSDLADEVDRLHEDAWDPYLQGAPWKHWDRLFDEFADVQVLLVDPRDGLIGVGHTVPFAWDGTFEDLPVLLDDSIERALDERRRSIAPTTLEALAAVVPEHAQQRGLSQVILTAMRGLAVERRLGSLISPIGPTRKHHYPITPMERYMRWTRQDGSAFDPWLRVHLRLGAEVLGVAPRTALCTGTVAQWEAWSGLEFPESGSYVVEGALQPVDIDRERDLGRYEDPGIWVCYRLGEQGR
jgi:hypothetical protein